MKKNVIAIVLAVVMAAGSVGTVPALAAETTAQESVPEEEETAEDTTEIESFEVEESTGTEYSVEGVTEENEENGEEPSEKNEDVPTEEADQKVSEEEAAEDIVDGANDHEQEEYVDEEIEVEDVQDPAMAGEGDVIASGDCSATDDDHVTWTLTGTNDNMTLIISGTGKMKNCSGGYIAGVLYSFYPWSSYNESVCRIIINDGVTSIGSYAFYNFASLNEIILPDNMIGIGEFAFMDCKSLTSVIIPYGVTSIEDSTFVRCHNLTNVLIPESVTSIGWFAFKDCKALPRISIPESVTSIGQEAFRGCRCLASIVIPHEITEINSDTFSGCSDLESVTIPISVTYIGLEAFSTCYHIKDVYYEGSEKDWNAIEIKDFNDYLTNATIHFNGKNQIEAELSQNLYYFDSANGDYQVFKPQPIVTSGGAFLSEKKDYTVEYKDNTSPGEATVVVTGTGDYAGTVELPFYLATISGLEEDYEYTGKEITPTFTLTADKKLQEGTDYRVRYEENTEPGKEYPRIIVTGSGDYSGELIIPFIIKPRAISQLSSKTGTQREINFKFEEHPCADGYIVEWRYEEDGEDKEPEHREIDADSLTIKGGNSKEKFEITTDDEGNHWCEFHGDSMPRAKHAVIQVQAYAEVNMPDGTVNYVKSDPSQELTVATGNQVIRKEMWGFANYGEQRTSTKLTEICGQAIAEIVSKIDQEDGQCFGMCWVGAYSVIYGDRFGTSSLQTIDSIENATNYTDNTLGWNAAEAIEYGQAVQLTNINHTEMDNSLYIEETNGKTYIHGIRAKELYDRILNCQFGTSDPVLLFFNAKHAILAMGISYEDEERVEIDVYDPNYLDKEPPKFILYKDNGSLEGPDAIYSYVINDTEPIEHNIMFESSATLDKGVLVYLPINQNLRDILNQIKSDSFTLADSLLLDIRAEDATELLKDGPIHSLNKRSYYIDNNRIVFWVSDADVGDRSLLLQLPHKTTLKFGNSKMNHEIILTTYGESNLEIVVDNPSYPSIKITPIEGNHFDLVSRFFESNKVTSTNANISSPTNGIVTVGMQNDGVTITGADEISCTSSTGTISGDGTVKESEVATLPVTTVETDGTYNYALFKESAVLKQETGDGEQTSYNIIYHDHVWDEGIVTTQPTVTSEGEKLLTCELCGETTTAELAKIEQVSIDKTTITGISSKTYTGKAQTQPVVVKYEGAKLVKDTDYTVSYKNNTKAGTASVIITGIGKYSGTATKNFTIKKAVNTITAKNVVKTYSAKAQTFALGVKIKNGTPKYVSNNKSVTVSKAGKVTVKAKFVGKATITITAPEYINFSKTTKKITITVNPTKTALSSVTSPAAGKMTVKWKKNAVGTGYQVQYSTSSKFATVKSAWLAKNTAVSKTFTGLTKGKKYYVRIRTFKTVGGVKYYSGWSTVKAVTVKK